jgi:small subunit ribosomal protein S3
VAPQLYRDFLKCDVLLREYLEKRLRGMYISSIEMERGEKTLRVIIKTSRPGILIGRSGEGSVRLRNDILMFLRKQKLSHLAPDLKLDIEEVRSPESNAAIVAQMVVEGLEKRMPFRRVLKQTVEKVKANRDVQGVRIKLSGRLGGADMARREEQRRGRIPLQTFRADVDFARARAKIPQGDIGVKVWIYKGEIFDK